MGSEQTRYRPQPLRQVGQEQIVLSLRGQVTLRGEISADDLAGFCRRPVVFPGGSACKTVICDVSAVGVPDLNVLNALARLQVFVRRHGKEIKLKATGNELGKFIDFTGFRTFLPTEDH